MEIDLGPYGLFYTSPEDVDVSTVHEDRRITAFGTWRRVPQGEDDPVESEATLTVALEDFPPPGMNDPEDLINLAWEEYQVEED